LWVKEGIESSTPGLNKILDGGENKAKAVGRDGQEEVRKLKERMMDEVGIMVIGIRGQGGELVVRAV
jgi:hypothetical protein